MKTLVIILAVLASGCSTTSGWDKGTALLNQGPNFQRPGQEANYNGDVKTASGTIITNNGMYTYSRVGNTIGFVRSGKSR